MILDARADGEARTRAIVAPGDEQQGKSGSLTLVAAGHTYGSHGGTNQGLYPRFLEALEQEPRFDHLILLGDFSRSGSADSMSEIAAELENIDAETLLVLGNHDDRASVRQFMVDRHGATHYAVDTPLARLIALDGQNPEWGQISEDQLRFLEHELDRAGAGEKIFVLLHELLWAQGRAEYADLILNWRSYEGRFTSNYWDDVHPMLVARPWLDIFVLAGDVGANRKGIAAFYHRLDNVRLIATGMGGHPDENYLRIVVRPDQVVFELVPLDADRKLRPLESYGLPD